MTYGNIGPCKPILFNTEMVQAILDGKKTQTRRVIKDRYFDPLLHKDLKFLAPVFAGDILWVREAWCNLPVSPDGHTRLSGRYYYKADNPDIRPDGWRGNWKPSIHMPKEAARIFLRVTAVRVERLQQIKMSDMQAEGVIPATVAGGAWQQWQHEFMKPAWNSTIKKPDLPRYGWEANPWVWVIEFERAKGEREE